MRNFTGNTSAPRLRGALTCGNHHGEYAVSLNVRAVEKGTLFLQQKERDAAGSRSTTTLQQTLGTKRSTAAKAGEKAAAGSPLRSTISRVGARAKLEEEQEERTR